LLGSNEIKTLTDLENLLKGKTLKQLIETFTQEIQNLTKELTERKKKIIKNNEDY
jgi:hypothetical protein